MRRRKAIGVRYVSAPPTASQASRAQDHHLPSLVLPFVEGERMPHHRGQKPAALLAFDPYAVPDAADPMPEPPAAEES